MRRFVLLFALLLAFAVNAQDTYFTTYSFVVEPQEEATVRQLVDDYYSKNKPEGVFVRLFENHFHDGGNTATHAIVFTGSLDDLSKMYDGGSSESFSLFLTRLNQHIKDGNGSAMGHHLAIYGDTNTRYPFQRYYYLKVKDPAAFDTAYKKFQAAHNPTGVIVNMGDISVGNAPNGPNRWAISGFKTMKAAMGGQNSLLSGAALTAREKAWDEFLATNGGAEVLRSGMRILLGAW
jgi:hypothetical protein